MTAQRYHTLKVQAVVEETHDAKSIVFAVPPELAREIRDKALKAGFYAANMPEEIGGGGVEKLQVPAAGDGGQIEDGAGEIGRKGRVAAAQDEHSHGV